MRYIIKTGIRGGWYLNEMILHGVFGMDLKLVSDVEDARMFRRHAEAEEIAKLVGGTVKEISIKEKDVS